MSGLGFVRRRANAVELEGPGGSEGHSRRVLQGI